MAALSTELWSDENVLTVDSKRESRSESRSSESMSRSGDEAGCTDSSTGETRQCTTHVLDLGDNLGRKLDTGGRSEGRSRRDFCDDGLESCATESATSRVGRWTRTQTGDVSHALVLARSEPDESIDDDLNATLSDAFHERSEPGERRGLVSTVRIEAGAHVLTARFLTSPFWSFMSASTCSTVWCSVLSSTPNASPARLISEIKSVSAMNLRRASVSAEATRAREGALEVRVLVLHLCTRVSG